MTMEPTVDMEKKVDQHSEYEYAPDEAHSAEDAEYLKREAAVVWKLDCFIAPVMMLLMLISYLDRGNIGFAATQGMVDDINLKSNQLNVSLHTTSYDATIDGQNRSLYRSFTSSTSWRNSRLQSWSNVSSSIELSHSSPFAGASYACALAL